MMELLVFKNDSRAVEAWTGIFIATISFWCWAAQWFGGWLDQLATLAGYEPLVGAVGISYGAFHFYKANHGTPKGRSLRCILAAWFLATLGAAVIQSKGWQPAGGIACILSAVIQAWCYLNIRWNYGH